MHRFAFEPAFSLAQMETLGSVGTDMAPTTFITIGTRDPILEPVTGSLFCVIRQLVELLLRQNIVVRVLADTRSL